MTADHVSPAGANPANTPAGKHLTGLGVEGFGLNTHAPRRGNHEVMMRGTFANVRLRNQRVHGVEGGFTRCFANGEVTTVYDAAMAYRDAGTRSSSWPARITAPGPPATGRPRAPRSSA